MFSEATGLFAITLGAYALVRPTSIRGFPTARRWEEAPEDARQEQRAYAALLGFSFVLGGAVLLVLGLLGMAP